MFKKFSGETQVRLRRDGILTAPAAEIGCDDGRQHSRHPQRLGQIGLLRVVVLRRILGAEVADRRADNIHGVAVVRHLGQE